SWVLERDRRVTRWISPEGLTLSVALVPHEYVERGNVGGLLGDAISWDQELLKPVTDREVLHYKILGGQPVAFQHDVLQSDGSWQTRPIQPQVPATAHSLTQAKKKLRRRIARRRLAARR